jgi:7-cyano-7-deazaguanine synthase
VRLTNREWAIICLSGGQDSATALAWAKKKFKKLFSVCFEYGQRHQIEVEFSKKLSRLAGCEKHFEIRLDQLFSQITKSALLEKSRGFNGGFELDNSLPASFVPFRNLYFITSAASIAYLYGIKNIVVGVSQTDFSGYPDCRNTFIKSLNATLELAVDSSFEIHAPLMYLSKKETVLLMKDLGYLEWYQYTHTCYEGKRPACGKCAACKLRLKGFEEAGIEDLIEYEEK